MRALTPTVNHSTAFKRSLLVLGPLILAFVIPAHLQEPAPVTKNYVRWAQEFLTSLYPDLGGKGYVASLETSFRYDVPVIEDRQFDLYIGRGSKNLILGYLAGYEGQNPPPTNAYPGPVYPEQLLISSFQFAEEGRLLSFASKGPVVGSTDKYREIVNLVSRSPAMTDSEAAAILKQAGARYGPSDKDEFAKHLPIEKLQRFFGPLKVASVDFPVSDGNGVRAGWPEWHVLAVSNGGGRDVKYQLWFEPFKGDLVRLSTIPSASNAPGLDRP
jgi:hypothetical protein